jgi:hypothetical protein
MDMNMLPNVRSHFSEAVIEVRKNGFVLFAFVALTSQVTLSKDENILDA